MVYRKIKKGQRIPYRDMHIERNEINLLKKKSRKRKKKLKERTRKENK